MRRRHFSFALILAIPTLTAACCCGPLDHSPGAEARRALRRAQDAWARAGVDDYRYRFQRSCYCGEEATSQVTIEVRDGEPVSVVYSRSGEPAPESLFGESDTVEELFEKVDRAIRENAYKLEVTYDEERGYPVEISLDLLENAVDDEAVLTVSDFEVLTGS